MLLESQGVLQVFKILLFKFELHSHMALLGPVTVGIGI